jgi:hypothetical protein
MKTYLCYLDGEREGDEEADSAIDALGAACSAVETYFFDHVHHNRPDQLEEGWWEYAEKFQWHVEVEAEDEASDCAETEITCRFKDGQFHTYVSNPAIKDYLGYSETQKETTMTQKYLRLTLKREVEETVVVKVDTDISDRDITLLNVEFGPTDGSGWDAWAKERFGPDGPLFEIDDIQIIPNPDELDMMDAEAFEVAKLN